MRKRWICLDNSNQIQMLLDSSKVVSAGIDFSGQNTTSRVLTALPIQRHKVRAGAGMNCFSPPTGTLSLPGSRFGAVINFLTGGKPFLPVVCALNVAVCF